MKRFALLLAMWPVCCLADDSCPVLNSATASSVLGRDVHAAVTHSNKDKDDVTCEFVRHQGALVYRLAIKVSVMPGPEKFSAFLTGCARPTVIRAIGNEAFACSVQKRGRPAEKVVGRVRNQAFTVRMSSNDPAAGGSLRENTLRIAEQVAGYLF